MSPVDVILWALAVLVVAFVVAIIIALIGNVARQFRKPKSHRVIGGDK